MKKYLAFLCALLLLPIAFADDVGIGIGIDVTTEEFPPHIWLCDSRVVIDDCVESGRISDCSDPLAERIENYAFEGEQLLWSVLVWDKNKVEEISDVVATLGSIQGSGDVEVECQRVTVYENGEPLNPECNARYGEELLEVFDEDTMDAYDCILTVETPYSMHGEFFVTVEVISEDGSDTMDENEYWFLNPIIALTVQGDMAFALVTPGTISYSETLLVGNDAEGGSGVLLDMFISGTDFYDPASSGAKCPDSNRLKLSQDLRSRASLGPGVASGATFGVPCDIDAWLAAGDGSTDNHDHLCYYATNGAYGTATAPNADVEGYRPIVYSDGFTRDLYEDAEVIWNGLMTGGYSAGNVLSPGAEFAINFKLGLPEPCVGDFSEGSIFFWGEAI